MQVVFTKDVAGVARKGDVKTVARGYFRNFLMPNDSAILATKQQVAHASKIEAEAKLKEERLRAEAAEIIAQLEGKSFDVAVKADGEKLYGAIHEADICTVVKSAQGVELVPKNVVIGKAIKKVGTHQVDIVITKDNRTTITVNVVAE